MYLWNQREKGKWEREGGKKRGGHTGKTMCSLPAPNFTYRISSQPDGRMWGVCVWVNVLQSTHGFLQQSSAIIYCLNLTKSVKCEQHCKMLGNYTCYSALQRKSFELINLSMAFFVKRQDWSYKISTRIRQSGREGFLPFPAVSTMK